MNKDIKDQIISALSDHLGIEPEDIKEEDSFENELHMRASDLSDFMSTLQGLGIDTEETDLTEVETVGDLINSLGGESLIQ